MYSSGRGSQRAAPGPGNREWCSRGVPVPVSDRASGEPSARPQSIMRVSRKLEKYWRSEGDKRDSEQRERDSPWDMSLLFMRMRSSRLAPSSGVDAADGRDSRAEEVVGAMPVEATLFSPIGKVFLASIEVTLLAEPTGAAFPYCVARECMPLKLSFKHAGVSGNWVCP